MSLPPVTEEDKPAIESMIKKLVRFRKREVDNNDRWKSKYLDDAIKDLCTYGEVKGWWKDQERDPSSWF
jgi:hypothetical protein